MDDIPFAWARDVLKLSISATASSAAPYSVLKEPKDPGRDPRFRKRVNPVLFSRRFLLTYNLVLLGVLVIFTIWHWGEKVVLARRRRARLANRKNKSRTPDRGDEAWSSSSSTIEGTATPPDAAKRDITDETSPLLAIRSPSRIIPRYWKSCYIVKAWMQHQPSPVPVINKTLPPNSVSLFVLAFIALNIFYSFYHMPVELTRLFVFADRCGIIFVANLPLLYLLSAKNQPIKFLTGYSYESLNIFHRRVGELLCFEAFLHLIGMIFVWYGRLRHLGFTLAQFLFNRVVGLGLGAFVAYEVLYFTSLGSFRQRCYEIFLASHIFLQIAGLALLFFHHYTSRPYVAISLAIFIVDRLILRLWIKTTSHPATLTVLEDDETLLVSSNWDTTRRPSVFMPQHMKHGWKPNDHIFVTVPSLSNKYILQAHPFTIFSAAPLYPSLRSDPQHAWFTLLIRAQHDSGFTRKLLKYAREHPNVPIRLDGPYGSSHALDTLEDSDNAIVVAGGSGIAVAYPLLWALLNPDANPATLTVCRKVKLLWITHSTTHQSWLPQDKMKELQNWGLQLFIPVPTDEVGRPNVPKILDGWLEGGRTGVVVSGPDGLVRDVRNTCAGMIGNGEDVTVQVEKFGW